MNKLNTVKRPRISKVPRSWLNDGIGELGQPVQIRKSISMYASQWKKLARLARPAPWRGNMTAFLRDWLDNYKP